MLKCHNKMIKTNLQVVWYAVELVTFLPVACAENVLIKKITSKIFTVILKMK